MTLPRLSHVTKHRTIRYLILFVEVIRYHREIANFLAFRFAYFDRVGLI